MSEPTTEKKEEKKKPVLTLSIEERLQLQKFFPQKHNALTLTLIESIIDKTEIKKEEMERLKFTVEMKETEAGGIMSRYNWTKELEVPLTVELDTSEVELLKSRAKEMDDKKELTLSLMPMYRKIREL